MSKAVEILELFEQEDFDCFSSVGQSVLPSLPIATLPHLYYLDLALGKSELKETVCRKIFDNNSFW